MARKQFSKSDIKKFLSEVPFADKVVTKKSKVVDDDGFIFVDDKLLFVRHDDGWFPTIKLLLSDPGIEFLPKVIVDMGAVKFVVNGADVMRPGIVGTGFFEKGSFVVIVDENNNKPLAIGKALFSSEEMMNLNSGKVVETLHFVGDEIWNK
jgi:PUA domain protein